MIIWETKLKYYHELLSFTLLARKATLEKSTSGKSLQVWFTIQKLNIDKTAIKIQIRNFLFFLFLNAEIPVACKF